MQVNPMPHEQYLDEPGMAINWITRIHQLHQEIENEQAEKAKAERG